MGKATAPLDMLQKCRARFAKEAEQFRASIRVAGSVWERNAATELATAAEKIVSEIDATLRDWG